MAGELGWFELGVEDPEKARTFYGGLFGWTFEEGGAGYGITTPGVPGGIHGGDPAAAPLLFFRVDDMDKALARVAELGGARQDVAVEGDEASQARFGRFVMCTDDQGSPFGLHQPPR
jgi:predicted enzyme related to lactoylglutathione lyase